MRLKLPLDVPAGVGARLKEREAARAQKVANDASNRHEDHDADGSDDHEEEAVTERVQVDARERHAEPAQIEVDELEAAEDALGLRRDIDLVDLRCLRGHLEEGHDDRYMTVT